MKGRNLLVAAAVLLTLSGCATITSSEMQKVALNTKNDTGQPVEKANCTLTNDKGAWTAESPGFVNVHRSADDLIVQCRKEGYTDGTLRAISRAAGGMFGNIIFGGGVGAIIDHAKGTGYNYPDDLPVVMGASTTVDRRGSTETEQTAAEQEPATVVQ